MKANSSKKQREIAQKQRTGGTGSSTSVASKKQARGLLDSFHRALSRSATKWYMMLGLAAAALIATCAPSCEQDVVLDLRTGLFEFSTPAGPAASPVTLVLDGLDLFSVSIDGAERWRLNATEGQPEEGSLVLRQAEEPSLNGIDPPKPTEIPREAGAIRSIDVPAGSDVTIKVSESDLIVTVSPSASGSPQAPCQASVSVGRGWHLESTGKPSVLGPFHHAELIAVLGRPGQSLKFFGHIDQSLRSRRAIGLQSVATSTVRVVEPMAPDAEYGVSELLGGTLSFPELPRREADRLWIGERVDGDKFEGVILLMEYVPPSRDNPDAEFVEPHLRVVWRGSISHPRIGHPHGLRDARPSLLEAWLARRSIADYVALATALLAFAALLLPHGEEEIAERERAVDETSKLLEQPDETK